MGRIIKCKTCGETKSNIGKLKYPIQAVCVNEYGTETPNNYYQYDYNDQMVYFCLNCGTMSVKLEHFYLDSEEENDCG